MICEDWTNSEMNGVDGVREHKRDLAHQAVKLGGALRRWFKPGRLRIL